MTRRAAYLSIAAVGLAITLWVLVLAAAKLDAGAMSALDLGIYSQVAWLTANGQWFGMTIHPHLYIGDHVEFLVVLGAIPLRLGAGALGLVLLQCLATVGAAFALFRFAKRYVANVVACGAAIVFLLNPFTLNALTFEFHAVLFGLPFAFLAADAFTQKRLSSFWLWCSLLLMTREDLALFVAGLAIIALLEKRHFSWWLWPLCAAGAWYVGAGILAGSINGEGYKFLSLFQPSTVEASALGEGFLSIFQFGNFLVLIALLASVLLLPLLAWRWLVLVILPLVGIGISGVSSGDLILQTHYATFFLPGLFCGALLGWVRLWQKPPLWLQRLGAHSLTFAVVLVAVVSLYSLLTFGPTIGAVRAWQRVTSADVAKASAATLDAQAHPTGAVLAGYSVLVPYAQRQQVYAGHYAYLGKRQFSERSYPLPEKLDRIVIDAQDFITYQLQYANAPTRADAYATGAERFRMLLDTQGLRLTRVVDTLLFFERTGGDLLPTLVTRTTNKLEAEKAFFFDAELRGKDKTTAMVTIRAQAQSPTQTNAQARLRWYDRRNTLLETRLLPLGYGIYPSASWHMDEVVATHFTLIIPENAARAEIEAIEPQGHLQLNGWRAAEPVLSAKTRVLSNPLSLPL